MREAPEIVHQLVKKFEEHKNVYLSPSYNEENLRVDFLNPFFTALGWDVRNEMNLAQAYRDVVQEEFLRTGDWGGEAPDYTFRIGKERKFFVEAKRPSENLQTNRRHVYQLRRYGWSSKLPISILTDFEELAVYETATRPQELASPTNARVLYLKFNEYVENWETIYNLFSREAVINGSLEQFAKEKNLRRGKDTVDDEFLKEIERWRSLLAEDLAKQNSQLTINQLNFAVQKIIDRIIFLRVCEDRGLEQYGKLQTLQNGNKIYARLLELFYQADEKYNSGLFHFSSKKDDSESADTFTPTLQIKDEVLKEIFNNLYYPTSPFVFEALPQEILGQVYEQFLGKIISLNNNHEATVEEKPEVKKAGGVYYTPSYIVDYIVKQTVGKLVEGKTPKQVEKLTIVDPACGSGSFLLGAYTFLLDWYRDWYINNDPQKYARGSNPAIYQAAANDWRLTITEKKKILLNNIYGVDIDYQAVEVTKLTLLLKLLEGEIQQHFADIGILPSLGKNIKCGNSLIGNDFYNQAQGALFNMDEQMRINAFDWENEFKNIMDAGGFDAVIGNPPYLSMEDMDKLDRDYYYKKFNNTQKYLTAIHKTNLYAIFWEKAINLVCTKGVVGFITPYSWLSNSSFISLRKLFLDHTTIDYLILLPFGVFKGAGIATGIVILKKLQSMKSHEIILKDLRNDFIGDIPEKLYNEKKQYTIPIELYKNTKDFVFSIKANNSENEIIKKMNINSIPLGEIVKIDRGCDTANNEKFIGYNLKKELNPKRLLMGKTFGRYWQIWDGAYLYYLPQQMKNDHETARPGESTRFEKKEKIIIYRFLDSLGRLIGIYDNEQYYCLGSTYIAYLKGKYNTNLLFILGILNSHLVAFYNREVFQGIKVTRTELLRLSIKKINFEDITEKNLHNKIVNEVRSIIELQKQLHYATTDQEKTVLTRQIDLTDKQIDQLVYQLYQLTPEEIKIIESE